MIKILVHSPKGGVGKTTFATNIALFLARKGYRVWALDLAQGLLMTRELNNAQEFKNSCNKIESNELGTVPNSFTGARNYDYLVADTDDYYNIMADLANDTVVRGWRVVVPVVNEKYGLIRIPEEIHQVMTANMLKGQSPTMRLFVNKVTSDQDFESVNAALTEKALEGLLSNQEIPMCNSQEPYYIDDEEFEQAIGGLLEEMGVSI